MTAMTSTERSRLHRERKRIREEEEARQRWAEQAARQRATGAVARIQQCTGIRHGVPPEEAAAATRPPG